MLLTEIKDETQSPEYKVAYKLGMKMGKDSKPKINPADSYSPIGVKGYNKGYNDGKQAADAVDHAEDRKSTVHRSGRR